VKGHIGLTGCHVTALSAKQRRLPRQWPRLAYFWRRSTGLLNKHVTETSARTAVIR